VIIANPNNPSGTYLPRAEIERLRAGLRGDILLIIDAAYAEYVEQPDYEPGVALADSTSNTIMSRTFSKVHGLAGLRLGWIYGDAGLIDVVGRIRSPFNVPGPAQAAGVAALTDRAHQTFVVDHCRRWRATLAQRLRGLGLTVSGSEGNFVTFGFEGLSGRTADAAEAFLRQHGILLRPMAAFGMPNYLRVTIGTDDEMAAFLTALENYLKA
jgi:histidinol-phosphate aminotransferase